MSISVKRNFAIGDRVIFRMAGTPIRGVIVEDRGKIGAKGRRLLLVEIVKKNFEGSLELPEAELLHVK